jgi:hypothetical protein
VRATTTLTSSRMCLKWTLIRSSVLVSRAQRGDQSATARHAALFSRRPWRSQAMQSTICNLQCNNANRAEEEAPGVFWRDVVAPSCASDAGAGQIRRRGRGVPPPVASRRPRYFGPLPKCVGAAGSTCSALERGKVPPGPAGDRSEIRRWTQRFSHCSCRFLNKVVYHRRWRQRRCSCPAECRSQIGESRRCKEFRLPINLTTLPAPADHLFVLSPPLPPPKSPLLPIHGILIFILSSPSTRRL